MIWKSGSEIRRLKLTLFLCNLRVKSPAELEAILQDWPAGKDSGIWLSIEIVLKQCRDLSSEDFKFYMELGYGQDPVFRGFFVHEKRRKVVAIFIFDRSIAQGALASGGSRLDAPNIRLWMQFEGIFVAFYCKDREEFLRRAFEVHTSHEKVQGTLAETLLGVKGSRLTIVATLDRLMRDGLLPQPDPKDKASASAPSEQQQSSPTISPLEKRSRRSLGSLGSPELGGLEASPSEELSREGAGAIHFVESLFELTEQEAKRGNIAPLTFEECSRVCASRYGARRFIQREGSPE